MDSSLGYHEPDTPNKLLDSEQVETNAGTVHRQRIIDAPLTTRIDPASPTLTYVGVAKQIDSSSPTAILFADGDSNFDNIWDDRAVLAYA
jgi:hypothetical protein